MNTCLRETTVVLKSFLCALPSEEVQHLRQKLEPAADSSPLPRRALRLRFGQTFD